jgi:hypothetical protein
MADVLGSQKTSQGAMGKDKIVMPATSLVSAGEAERGRKGNEGKALGYGSRLASSSNPPYNVL